MPDERLIHPAEGESEKLTQLSNFEYRVWIAYKVCANDVGVMLDSPSPLQTGNRFLRSQPSKDVRRAVDRMLGLGLLLPFEQGGEHYVCSPVWQDWQRVKHPRQTHLPLPDDTTRSECSEATQALFRKVSRTRYEKSERLRNVPDEDGESLEANARGGARNANANATANAPKGEEPERGTVLELAPGQLRLAALQLVAEWNARVRPPLVAVTNPEPSLARVLAAVRARPDMSEWQSIIDRCVRSEFLMGLVPGPDGKVFKLDFWWLLAEDHADRVLSGRYDNRAKAAAKTEGPRRAPSVAETRAMMAAKEAASRG